MQINMINQTSFGNGYNSILKTLYKEGAFGDRVLKGFYGGTLTPRNVTLEHLKPHSQNGRNDLSNFVLATMKNNHLRGTKSLKKVIDMKKASEYLEQFRGILIRGKFDGNNYIRMITKRLKDMGIVVSPVGWERRLKSKPVMTVMGRKYR